ncbi:sigma factor, partial [Okeania sp. SIO2G5]|uniref:sigma factor n=1 Tax=Okeania sp. SIO2G5 TaxID=2607796 RepID=UPI0013BF3BBA
MQAATDLTTFQGSSHTSVNNIALLRKNIESLPLDNVSHHDLIIRCQQGARPDKAAFAELLRRYQSHLEKVLYHLAPDWSDRADLVQEVWIRVYRN